MNFKAKNQEQVQRQNIQRGIKNWGKSKFNPRTVTAAETGTPWHKFKQNMIESEREVKNATAMDMSSAEAQAFQKQRQQNYMRVRMESKRNEQTKWEDFTNTDNAEKHLNEVKIPCDNRKQNSTEVNEKNIFNSKKQKQGKVYNNRVQKHQFKKNTGYKFNENNNQVQNKGTRNPFKTEQVHSVQNPRLTPDFQKSNVIDVNNMDLKTRNYIRHKITKATVFSKGFTLDAAIEDSRKNGVIKFIKKEAFKK